MYCPAITDGSVGDMIYFFSYKRPGFILDIARDIRGINDEAVRAHATGMIILGGGLVKHHTCNANLMRNGASFSVFINTGQAFDGSDSGAAPDEVRVGWSGVESVGWGGVGGEWVGSGGVGGEWGPSGGRVGPNGAEWGRVGPSGGRVGRAGR